MNFPFHTAGRAWVGRSSGQEWELRAGQEAQAIQERRPHWVQVVTALVPVVPPLSLVAFGALGQLRTLPRLSRWVLAFFAGTQLLAGALSPDPLWSLPLSLLRVLLTFAMLGAGIYLRGAGALRPLLWGQLVVFATAWVLLLHGQGLSGLQQRMGHPYYYTVSLGLVSVLAMFLVTLWRGGRWWWRLPALAVSMATFIGTSSRGALLVLGVGTLAALAFSPRDRQRWLLVPVTAFAVLYSYAAPDLGQLVARLQAPAPVAGAPARQAPAPAAPASPTVPAAPVPQPEPAPPPPPPPPVPVENAQRLTQGGLSNRDRVWSEALAGWRTSPLAGVGPYRSGEYIPFLIQTGCALTPAVIVHSVPCPSPLSAAWFTAHDIWLQWLLETGVLGTLGLLALTALIFWRAALSGDPLLQATVFGMSAMNFVDVVTELPSQHFAEVWWVMAGIALGGRALQAQGSQARDRQQSAP